MKEKNELTPKSDEQIQKEAREEVVKALTYYRNTFGEEYANISSELVNFTDRIYQNIQSAINYAFLLNSGAAAALCSMLNGHDSLVCSLLFFFAVGIILTSVSLGLISTSRSYYLEYLTVEKERFNGMLYLLDKEIEDETFKPQETVCFEKVEEYFSKSSDLEKSYKKYQNFSKIAVIAAFFVFFVTFFLGLFTFAQSSVPNQQISYSDLSYPGVQITPLPITKPN